MPNDGAAYRDADVVGIDLIAGVQEEAWPVRPLLPGQPFAERLEHVGARLEDFVVGIAGPSPALLANVHRRKYPLSPGHLRHEPWANLKASNEAGNVRKNSHREDLNATSRTTAFRPPPYRGEAGNTVSVKSRWSIGSRPVGGCGASVTLYWYTESGSSPSRQISA